MSLSLRDDKDEDIVSFTSSSSLENVPLYVCHDLPRSPPSNFRIRKPTKPLAVGLHETLPNEIVLHALSYLDRKSLAKLVRVSKSWCVSHVATHNLLWQPIFNQTFATQDGRQRVSKGFSHVKNRPPSPRNPPQAFVSLCTPRFRLFGDYVEDSSHPQCFFRRMRVVCYFIDKGDCRVFSKPKVNVGDPVKVVEKCYLGTRGDFSVRKLKDYIQDHGMLHEYGEKTVVVGDGCVGKTSLLVRICKDRFNPSYTPTIFDNMVARIDFLSSLVAINLWDTAGEEDYDSLRPLSYQETDVFLMTYDMVNPTSWNNVKLKWVDEVLQYAPNAAIIPCGCKSDLLTDIESRHFLRVEGKEPVSREEVIEYAREIGSEWFLETSAKDGIVDHVLYVALTAAWLKRVGKHQGSRCGVM